MTEAEALTKVCCGPPALFVSNLGGKCLGAACMAWREHHVWRNYYKKSGEPVKPGDTYTLAQVEERREPMNFCGLAGAPE